MSARITNRFSLLKKTNRHGQVLLLVLFAMAVVLTVALYPLSRSITDISITENEEEASRAFAAAEAGLEKALIGLNRNQTFTIGDSTVSTSVSYVGSSPSFIYPDKNLTSGKTATLWLVSHNDDGSLVCDPPGKPCIPHDATIRVCWGTSATPKPAIEATLLHLNTNLAYSTAQIKRWAIDPDDSGRRTSNGFTDSSTSVGACGTSTYSYSVNLDFDQAPNGLPASRQPVLLQITFYYNDASPLAFSTTNATIFPAQGELVQAKGTYGQATQSVQVTRSYSTIPPILTSVMGTKEDKQIIKY